MDDRTEVGLEFARAQLATAVARFPQAVSLLRRELFRQHLALNVAWATPLMDVVAGAEGLDFAEAAWAIAPPRAWPERPLPTDARATLHGIDRRFEFKPPQIWRRHRLAGVIVRTSRRSDDMIGMRVLGDGIEFTAIDGALNVESYHGLGRIMLAAPLPATIAIAACGRRVGDVIGHRWLTGRDWPVVRVDEGEDRTWITFETGRDPWSAPWPARWDADEGEQS